MRIVLLSGGAGKRLWPMSNDSRSKQFLRVLRDDAGNSVSMVQRVWSQLADAGLQEQAFICAARSQVEMIESQLGPVPFIEEPVRRDTFPAIALSVTYLSDEVGCGDDEVVAVMPVDAFVSADFFVTMRRMEKALRMSGANLALMGVRPTEPTSKFGYIRTAWGTDTSGSTWHSVDSFVEKPDEEEAANLMAEGALWNCGVFCFKIGFLKSKLLQLGYPSTYRELVSEFDMMPKRSFDYEIVEQTRSVVVVPYHGTWSDLGTWGSLSEQITDKFVGQGTAVACQDTHIINELGIPLVAMGLKHTMVVSTPDGILVADKEHAASIKLVTASWTGRPMYEERRWGSYRVLDYQKLDDQSEVLTKCIDIQPGKYISYQKHGLRTEVWTVIEGSGELVLDGHLRKLCAGDVVHIAPEQWHGIRATERLQLIEVQRGTALFEEDVVRQFNSLLSCDNGGDFCGTGKRDGPESESRDGERASRAFAQARMD